MPNNLWERQNLSTKLATGRRSVYIDLHGFGLFTGTAGDAREIQANPAQG